MTEFLLLTLAWIVGVAVGAVVFGGLWWTVRRGLSSKSPALWFMGSLLVRTGIVLAGFYWVGRGDLPRLGACLAGFVCARFMVMRLTRTPGESATAVSKEIPHAP